MAGTSDGRGDRAAHPVAFGRIMRGRIQRDGDGVRLSLAGEFDMAAAADFAAVIADIEVTSPSAIVLDLTGLSYMDSTGLRALLAAHERAAGSHVFAVLNGIGPAHRVIALAGIETYLMMIDDPSEIRANAML